MKNRALTNDRVDGIKNFIRLTCEGCTDGSSKHLNFHKDLITHYFEAKNVEIYYERKKIVAEIFVGKDYVPIHFECLDISVFLSSCVKEDRQSLEFYQDYIKIFSTTMAQTERDIQEEIVVPGNVLII